MFKEGDLIMEKTVFSAIQNKLILQEKYKVFDAAVITANILTCYDEDIKKAIISWANGDDVSSFELNGSTVSDVSEELSCSVFQALCFMNALTKDVDIYMDAVLRLEGDYISNAEHREIR